VYFRKECHQVLRNGCDIMQICKHRSAHGWPAIQQALLRNLLWTNPRGRQHANSIARNQRMKIIAHKQIQLAIEHVAGLLKKDGQAQTLTVQELLDAAQFHPAQFPSSLPALEILGLLGLGDEMVRSGKLG
jgi:hypothetical protein